MSEYILTGTPVSLGIGIGRINVLDQETLYINRNKIQENKTSHEMKKLDLAIGKALLEIHDLCNDFKGKLDKCENRIFEAYGSILQDRYFIEEIKDLIVKDKISATYAADVVIQRYVEALESASSEYTKQRAFDLKDIKTRIIRNIAGEKKSFTGRILSGQIVVVKELTASLAAALCRKKVYGVLAKNGAGYLSHAVIILRSLKIPVLGNVDFEEATKYSGYISIIDSNEGVLLVGPENHELEKYNSCNGKTDRLERRYTLKPPVTLDGHRIGISSNVSNMDEYEASLHRNIDGIGLVRTEMLFLNNKSLPGEKEQFEIYSKIIRKMGNKPVIIRTADLGGDKIPAYLKGTMAEVASLRGISRSLSQKEQLVTQIRSILRVSGFGNVSITFPMVNNAEEIRVAKEIIDTIRNELITQNSGLSVPKMKIGAVIETKGSIEHLKSILAEVDFINIGTNDLIHQVLNEIRKGSEVKQFQYLNPSFLRVVRECVVQASKQDKLVSICGEMACDPEAAVILIGMGANDLSMAPSYFLPVIEKIRKTSFKMAIELANKAVECSCIDEVKYLLKRGHSPDP